MEGTMDRIEEYYTARKGMSCVRFVARKRSGTERESDKKKYGTREFGFIFLAKNIWGRKGGVKRHPVSKSFHSGDHSSSHHDDMDDEASKPLGERVVQAIQGIPDRTIRPAKLAALLGISVNEACAELCGLMAAVGPTATFVFETLPTTTTSKTEQTGGDGKSPKAAVVMVFTFPPDFATKAVQGRQRAEQWQDIQDTLQVAARGLKIITAFGLILSLLILLVAAVVGVVAVLIASSQNDRNGRGRSLVLRQLHSLMYTFRQLLWCYALFGPDMGDDNTDPFLRETAYDLALLCSVCCGNPSSLFFWMRARQLSQRRHRMIYRGWSSTGTWGRSSSGNAATSTAATNAYGVEGVTLVRQGTRGNHDNNETVILGTESSEHRGLLSVAVDFLFGPTPFHPPHAEADKWKLRASVMVQTSTVQGGITLRQMAPYADEPPKTIENTAQVVQQGLLQVAFLNGVLKETDEVLSDKSQAVFVFPELMAESATVLRYEPPLNDVTDGSFLATLYAHPNFQGGGRRITSHRAAAADLPTSLREPYYHFTKLTSAQFMYCLGLGLLNAFGVYWLAQSLQPAGALGPLVQGTLRTLLVGGLLPILSFYAKLFFALPAGRLVLVAYLNHVRRQRNEKRENLSRALAASATTTL
eukprot:scaffold1151_cov152-Amphora_coffeaeformis.AAC.1